MCGLHFTHPDSIPSIESLENAPVSLICVSVSEYNGVYGTDCYRRRSTNVDVTKYDWLPTASHMERMNRKLIENELKARKYSTQRTFVCFFV